MHLRERAFAFDDLRASHVRPNFQPLSDEIVEGIVNGIHDTRLLSQIHILPFQTRSAQNGAPYLLVLSVRHSSMLAMAISTPVSYPSNARHKLVIRKKYLANNGKTGGGRFIEEPECCFRSSLADLLVCLMTLCVQLKPKTDAATVENQRCKRCMLMLQLLKTNAASA